MFKHLICVFFLGLLPLAAQVIAPPEVVKSAEDAVNEMGKKIVMGEHEIAVQLMYPQWKERLAKRIGGMEKLEEQLRSIGPTMARNGISILSVATYGEPKVHEVWPGKGADGAEVMTKWLLLVPTVTELRVLQNANPKPALLKVYGFQVAVADKDKLNWTFINGSDVTVSDLRSFFTSLPANLQLPEVKREEVK
ncbi:MAG: hypothetical protein MUF31_03900 [Akkermansiaceae bacterium]|nr:hypothetical protein [Akkermansiaceae bacterium]